MDNKRTVSISNPNSSQQKFFQWAVKWFYTNHLEDTNIKPDAPELACFLQAIGFQLREFIEHEDNSENQTTNNSLKVTIECGSSKMRAVMELDDVTCQCPNQDDAKDASFWSVSGTAPLGSTEKMNRIVETGSNLLPSITKDLTRVMHDVTQYLFKLIKNIPDLNQNTDSNLNLSAIEGFLKVPSGNDKAALKRWHTQPDFNIGRCRSLDTLTKNGEINNYKVSPSPLTSINMNSRIRNRSSSVSVRKSEGTSGNKVESMEERENVDVNVVDSSPAVLPSISISSQDKKTVDKDLETSIIEGEPRPSPPKNSSSPVSIPQLCTSLGQISLPSPEKNNFLVELLLETKANLERALKMLLNNSQTSNISLEGVFLKPAAPENFSFKSSSGNNSRPASSCSLPIKPETMDSNPRKLSVRRNVAASFRKNSAGMNSPSDKKSTPNRSLLQRRSLGGPTNSSKPSELRVATPRPGTSSTLLNSSTSRMIIAAKRRVSPDPKSSPSQIGKSNTFLSTSSMKTSLGSHKLQPGSTINKFGFIKKKV